VLLVLWRLAARGLLFAAAVASAATAAAAALAATRAARLALAARGSRPGAGADDRIGVHVQSATVAVLAGGGEDLDQPAADPLTGHLHQAQRGHLGDLVAGAVAPQRLGEPTQHQVPVRLEHHVD